MTIYKKTKQISQTDAAYIAGIIDGEGTISLTRRHKNENRQLEISVANTEMPLLNYLLETIGTGRITKKKTYNKRHTPSATYLVSNRQALSLLEQIFPFLLTYKRHRAKVVLRDYLRLTPRNGKYSTEIKQQRKEFINNFFETKIHDNEK